MEYNDKCILPPAAITEVNSLLTHIQRGCLSGILPGRGTNRNERLHRELNKHMRQSRYGVELAYALLTKVFFLVQREDQRTYREKDNKAYNSL